MDRRGRQIYRRLAQFSLEDQGLSAIAEALLRIVGKPIVVQDEHLTIQALAWPEEHPFSYEEFAAREDEDSLQEWLWGRALDGKAPPCTELTLSSDWARCVAAIVIEGNLRGYLSVLGAKDNVDDLDRLAVERGALVCAAEMAKRRAVEAAEDRLRGDFLDLMLTAGPAEERALARRAKDVGYDLEAEHTVVIFDPDGDDDGALTRLASEFRARLLNSGVQAFLCSYDEDLVALCSAEKPSLLAKLEDLSQASRDQIAQRSPGTCIAVGIGRPGSGLQGLRRSFGQAQRALALARRLFGGDRVLPFSHLGIYRLLCRLQGTEELRVFHSQTLGPLCATTGTTTRSSASRSRLSSPITAT